MEIVIEPPRVVAWVLLLPVVTAFVIFLATKVGNKRIPWWQMVLPVVFVTVPSLVVVGTAFKRRTFAWNEVGIVDHSFGGDFELHWSDIDEVRRVPDLWGSEWNPVVRTNGMAYEGYRAGQFRMANGKSAHMFLMTTGHEALVLVTKKGTYVYAPVPFDDFAATVTRHVPPRP